MLRLSLALGGAFGAMVWVALVLWVFRDAQRRTNNPLAIILSTVLVAATFVIGWTIYLLLRPQQTLSETYRQGVQERADLLAASEGDLCPRCHTRILPDYRVCPHCGLDVKQPCDFCKRPVRPTWNLCPYCGHAVHLVLPERER
ncbi:MAG: zinc ribbon domain-containing protein [Chloroflexota bacterium]|nr:zinc ribbon domain-containing protein [Chloroflexota bacterium]